MERKGELYIATQVYRIFPDSIMYWAPSLHTTDESEQLSKQVEEIYFERWKDLVHRSYK